MLAGSLEIQLAADVARLRQDMSQANGIVSQGAKQMQKALDDVRSTLTGLFGGVSAAGFGVWIKSAIDFQDQLNDLNKTTDISVSKLAGISLMSRQTGSDLTGMAQAMNKLTLEMGKAPEKFAKLGITAKDPLEAFKQMSDVFRGIEDPQLRAAVAAEALGKGWASAAPALAEGSKAIGEMVARGEELAGITKRDTDMADAFNDALSEMQLALMGSASNVSAGLLPVLTALIQSLTDATHEANESVEGFDALTETLRALIVFGGNVAFVLNTTGKELGVLGAQIAAFLRRDFDQAVYIGKEWTAEADKRRAAFDAWEQRMMSAGKTARTEAEQSKAALGGVSTAALKAFVDTGAASAAAKKLAEERRKEEEFRMKWGRQQAIEAGEAVNKRNEEFQKEEEEAWKKKRERWLANHDHNAKTLKDGSDMLEQLEFETRLLGMTNQEREVAIGLRELERAGIVAGTEAFEKYGAAIKTALEQKGAATEHKRIWDSIDTTAHDVFTNVFENGSNAFKRLGQTLKASVLDLLYQMTIRKWILQFAATGTGQGISGAVSSATGSAGGSMLTSMGGSALSSLGMATGANAVGFGTGAMTTMGQLGAVGTNLANAGTLAAGGSWMGALGVVAPYLAAIAAIYLMFSKKGGGPKMDGQAGAFGDMNSLTGQIAGGSNPLGGAMAPAVATLQADFDKLVTSFGGSTGTKFGLGVSRDPKGTSATFLEAMAKDAKGNTLFSNLNRNVGRSDEDLQNALSVAAMDSIIGALKASDIGPEFKKFFDTLAPDASQQEKAAAIGKASALLNERASLEDRLFQLTGTSLEKLNKLRDAERASIDASNHALLNRIYAEEDAQRRTDIRRETLLEGVNTARDVLMDAYQRESALLRETADRAKAAAAGLRDLRDSLFLGENSPLGAANRTSLAARTFNDTYAKAQAGDLDAMAKLQGASTSYLAALKETSVTRQDFAVGFARVTAALTLTAAKADSTATLAQVEIAQMEAQLSILGLINTNLVKFAEAAVAYKAAANNYVANDPQASAINSLYQSILGRDGELSGIGYYQGWLDRGLTLADVAAAMQNSPEKLGVPQMATGTNFVPRDMLAMVHEGEAVVPRQYNPAANGSSDAGMATRFRELETDTRRTREMLEGVINGSISIRTRTTEAML